MVGQVFTMDHINYIFKDKLWILLCHFGAVLAVTYYPWRVETLHGNSALFKNFHSNQHFIQLNTSKAGIGVFMTIIHLCPLATSP